MAKEEEGKYQPNESGATQAVPLSLGSDLLSLFPTGFPSGHLPPGPPWDWGSNWLIQLLLLGRAPRETDGQSLTWVRHTWWALSMSSIYFQDRREGERKFFQWHIFKNHYKSDKDRFRTVSHHPKLYIRISCSVVRKHPLSAVLI